MARRWKLPWPGVWSPAFLLFAILTGPFLILHVPPGHVPDEGNHALRADSLLHGQVIGHRETQNGATVEGLVTDRALRATITLPVRPMDTRPEPLSPVRKWLATQVPWNTKAEFTDDGTIAGYMPLFYLPGATGIALSRLLDLSPFVAFLAARLANFYGFLLIGATALRLTRRGAPLLFCVLLLPMTLSLAASASQDGLIIATAALAAACLSRTVETAAAFPSRWHVASGCLLALVIAGKPPYAPLALLMLLPVHLRPRAMAERAAAAALVVVPALLWTVLEARVAATAPLRAAAEAGPLWPGPRPALFTGPDLGAQLRVLAAHPLLAIALPLGSIARSASDLLRQAVGVLDWLGLILPAWLYAAWFAAIPAAIAAEPVGPRLRPADAVLVLPSLLLCAIFIGLALYLEWTPVGMPFVGGLQGRYFLPLLPFAALAMPRFGFTRLGIIPLCAAAIDAAALPGLIAAFYPLR